MFRLIKILMLVVALCSFQTASFACRDTGWRTPLSANEADHIVIGIVENYKILKNIKISDQNRLNKKINLQKKYADIGIYREISDINIPDDYILFKINIVKNLKGAIKGDVYALSFNKYFPYTKKMLGEEFVIAMLNGEQLNLYNLNDEDIKFMNKDDAYTIIIPGFCSSAYMYSSNSDAGKKTIRYFSVEWVIRYFSGE